MSVVLIYRCRLCEDIIEEPLEERATLQTALLGIGETPAKSLVSSHECSLLEGERSLGVTDLIGASETIEEEERP